LPQVYEKIKADQLKKGLSLKAAKTHAAKIYNWLRSKHPSMEKLSNKPESKE